MTDHEAKQLNPRQQRFVELVAGGMPAGRAYEAAGFGARGKSADEAASRMLARNVKVSAAISKLREAQGNDCRWSRKRAMDWLCEVLEVAPGDVTKYSALAQSWQAATERTGEKLSLPGKIDAFRELAKMCGWYEPEKSDDKLTIEFVKNW